MKFSSTYIPLRLFPIFILSILYALFLPAAFRPIVSFPAGLLMLKSCVDACVILGMGALLTVIIPSSNYVRLGVFQRFINLIALGLTYISVLTLTGYLSSILLFGDENSEEIRSLIPLSAFIGLFVYVIQALVISSGKVRDDAETEKRNEENPETDATAPYSFKDNVNNNRDGEAPERVAVKVGQKIHVILVPDIIYISSDGDYVQIVTGQHKFLKEETMKYFESVLPSSRFVRVHRSYIVNVEKILRIELYEKQTPMLTLKNGDKIRASVSGYKTLRSVLNL